MSEAYPVSEALEQYNKVYSDALAECPVDEPQSWGAIPLIEPIIQHGSLTHPSAYRYTTIGLQRSEISFDDSASQISHQPSISLLLQTERQHQLLQGPTGMRIWVGYKPFTVMRGAPINELLEPDRFATGPGTLFDFFLSTTVEFPLRSSSEQVHSVQSALAAAAIVHSAAVLPR